MDTTFDSLISYVYRTPNKRHWRVKSAIKRVNSHIGGLRLLAREKRGTYIAFFSNFEANRLERSLERAIVNRK